MALERLKQINSRLDKIYASDNLIHVVGNPQGWGVVGPPELVSKIQTISLGVTW